MFDNVTKWLLSAVVILLCILLLHLFVSSAKVEAQASVQSVQIQPQIAAEGGRVYVLSNGKLSVYYWEISPKLDIKPGKLRFLTSLPIDEKP